MAEDKEINKSVASNRLSVVKTRETELTEDEEAQWEEMTKKRLEREAVSRRQDRGLIIMFIIMVILCIFLLYCYDQHLFIFKRSYLSNSVFLNMHKFVNTY